MFAEIVDGGLRLNACGEIVRKEWEKKAQVRPYIVLDEYIVMPNHVHGIIVIDGDGVGATRRSPLRTMCRRKVRYPAPSG